MPFSDEDVKYLNAIKWAEHEKHQPRDCGELASLLSSELPRLISRLEAAEKVLTRYPSFVDAFDEYQAWRKASGK